MIIGHDSLWKQYRNSRKYTAEEEFYLKVLNNPVWPFEDLGNGIYHLRLRSARVFVGIVVILATGAAGAYFFIVSGLFSFPACVCIIFLVFGVMCLLGKLTTQELIIGREVGYLLRLEATRKVIVEQDIYNIYIRLQKKSDSVQVEHCYLIIGGYLLDDIRISRMTHNEGVMRILGKHLALNLGINYFDYHDETIKHCVYHFRTTPKDSANKGEELDVLFDKKPEFHVESETQVGGMLTEDDMRDREEALAQIKSRVRIYAEEKSVFHRRKNKSHRFLRIPSRKSVAQTLMDQLTFKRSRKKD